MKYVRNKCNKTHNSSLHKYLTTCALGTIYIYVICMVGVLYNGALLYVFYQAFS